MRQELDLPTSELTTLAYPYMLPSPPTPASPNEAFQDNSNPSVPTPLSTSSFPKSYASASSVAFQRAEEQSWFYYLTEIALRRILNRVLHYFYREDNDSWLRMNMYEMVSTAEDLEVQLESWYVGRISVPHHLCFKKKQPCEVC